jgi:hypothetical protein
MAIKNDILQNDAQYAPFVFQVFSGLLAPHDNAYSTIRKAIVMIESLAHIDERQIPCIRLCNLINRNKAPMIQYLQGV